MLVAKILTLSVYRTGRCNNNFLYGKWLVGDQIKQQNSATYIHLRIVMDCVHRLSGARFRSEVDNRIYASQRLKQIRLTGYAPAHEVDAASNRLKQG